MLDWLGTWLTAFWYAIKSWFLFFFDVFVSFFESFFLTLYDLLKDVFYFIVDAFLKLTNTIIASLPFKVDFLNPCQAGIPPDVLNVLGLIGAGEGLGIIASAILIRIFLQLIPFTRLGS